MSQSWQPLARDNEHIQKEREKCFGRLAFLPYGKYKQKKGDVGLCEDWHFLPTYLL